MRKAEAANNGNRVAYYRERFLPALLWSALLRLSSSAAVPATATAARRRQIR